MNDFIFQNSTKVYFGTNQLNNLPTEVLKYGNKTLLAYGSNRIKNTNSYHEIMKVLTDNHIEVFELPGVEPNPRHTTVNKGVALCKENGITSVIALGGGSTIDCCKAIGATALSTSDNIWDLVEGKTKWKDALAIIAIPTIASTGSEMDKSCVIANTELGIKSGINGEAIRPKAAFLDPTLTYSVPKKQTACGGFDIMCHLFDMNYFVSADKYALQFNVVETLLKTVKEQLPIALQQPDNYEARATLLWAASWALNSFCTSGFKTQASLHALEQFSSTLDMTHGLGLAILAPKWMRYVLVKDPSKAEDFARFAINVMGVSSGSDPLETATKGIEALQTYIKTLGLPEKLSELGITQLPIEEMAEKGLKGAESLSRAYVPLTKQDFKNIYEMCL